MPRSSLFAEFGSADALERAVDHLRALGYTELEAYTPFPLRHLDQRLGLRRSKVPLFVLAAGLTGAGVGYLVQWWCTAVDFPLDVGGRPLHSAPAFIPITFESAVLFASLTAFVAVLALARLPRLWHPVFEIDGFERASIDRFWLEDAREAGDERAATTITKELLSLGALRVEPSPEAA